MDKIRRNGYWIYVLQRAIQVLTQQRARILAYHSVSDQRIDRYAIHPRQFERQMQSLRTKGMVLVSLSELVHRMQRRESLKKLVVITFDDGYQDFLECAIPILREYQVPAVVFVPVGMLGNKSRWSRVVPDAQLMTEWQVEQVVQEGAAIGSHSMTHPRLPMLPETLAVEEFVASRDWLQARFRLEWLSFAYPFGDFGRRESQMAHQAGYRCAVGFGGLWGNGLETNLFELNRDAITREYNYHSFQRLLNGWSDWTSAIRWALQR